jgi:conjugative transposon protein TcpC
MWAARRRGSSAARRVRVARTPAELVRGVGRAVLWCLVAVLLLRGAGDVLATPEREPVRAVQRGVVTAWPDDRTRAFSVQFARAYLTSSPRQPERSARAVLAFVAPELTSSVVPQVAQRDADPVTVQDAVVADVERLDDGRALVTVAAMVSSDGGVRTRYLVVPVARDAGRGLVVFDLPSFAAPPPRGSVEPSQSEPLTGADAAQVEDVLVRFFRAFLGGRSDELEYLVPAGARIAALDDPVELLGVDSVAEPEREDAGERFVLATVRVRDPAFGAVFGLRYRVRLVRGDRWYVAAMNTARKEG